MYTKSSAKAAKHEWTSHAENLGDLSNIGLQVFMPIGGANFTSIACAQLDCATFILLPASNIIFSLASFPIKTQPLPFAELSASIASLCAVSWNLFKAWQVRADEIGDAVVELRKALKAKT
jgi:hypothetical protein